MMPRWRKRLAWIGPYLTAYRAPLALALVLGLAAAAFSCALMFCSGYLISGTAAARGSILLLYVPIIYVRIFGGGKPILAYLERLVSHDWVLRMTSRLRLRLYRALEHRQRHAAGRAGGGPRTGEVLGVLAEDIGHLQNLYLRSAFPTAIAWALYLIVLVAAGALSPALACVFGVGCLASVAAAPLASAVINGAREERHRAAKAELYAGLTDDVLGIADWVCSGRRGDYLGHGGASRERARAAERAGRRFDRRRDALVRLSLGLTAVAVLAWAGARFGGPDGAAAGATVWIAAFALGFFLLAERFAPLSAAASEGRGQLAAVDRMAAIGEDEGDGAQPAPERPAGDEPSPAGHDLALTGVRFAYPGAVRETLRGIDLAIPAGQHIAVLGRSGAGKSTLASLLHGDLAPSAGTVELGGVPCDRLPERMPDLMGVVQQETYLFNTTLFDNLCVAKADATRDQARDALERVGLGPLLERLPQRIDTMVDEGGLRFSGGERHRIALARALLRRTPVVLLDEPFAALDPATEQALLDTLLSAFADRTLILITHHLQGIEAMDRVVFIEDGRIELDGSPAELARTSGRYRALLAFDRGEDVPPVERG